MISDKNRELIDRAIELLKPEGLQCSKYQIRRAGKLIYAAILALSSDERKRERRVRQLAQFNVDEEELQRRGTNAVKARWQRYPCGMMTSQEFRELSSPWSATELAYIFGITKSRIIAYRRKSQPCRIPDDVAIQLLELVKRTKEEQLASLDQINTINENRKKE